MGANAQNWRYFVTYKPTATYTDNKFDPVKYENRLTYSDLQNTAYSSGKLVVIVKRGRLG